MKDSKDLEKLRKDIATEINKIRTEPKSYLPILDKYINSFKDGNNLTKPGTNIILETEEGKAAYIEAKKFLEKQKPLPELNLDDYFSKASQRWADEIGEKGSFDSDENNPYIDKYVEYTTPFISSIDYGSKTAEELITSQVVDDGLPKRPHRKALFNRIVKNFGVGVAPHKSDYEVVSVVDYVKEIKGYKEVEEEKDEDQGQVEKTEKIVEETEIQQGQEEKEENFETKKIIIKKEETKTEETNEPGISVIEDKEAPAGAVRCHVRVYERRQGKTVLARITKKTYTMKDGSTKEFEDVENF